MKQKTNAFDILLYFLMGLVILIVAYPLWFVVIASVSDPTYTNTGRVLLLPRGLTFTGYSTALQEVTLWRGYLNSIVYTVLFCVIGLVVILPAAFSLSQPRLKLKGPIMTVFMIAMYFNGGLIPTYLLIKNLGMLDSMWAVILPTCVSVYNMIVARTFFANSIPYEIQESARIDGCSSYQVFLRIALPLSKAIIAVITLWYAVSMWNSYFNALVYLTTESKYPLQLVLREILFRAEQLSSFFDEDSRTFEDMLRASQILKYVVMIFASIPLLIAYPFVQKFFVKGVMIGSVKG